MLYYEDSDGFKKTKEYDFDEMMKRAWPDAVKVKAKFPRNTASHFEDYLICVTTVKDGHDNCINESRLPGKDKERVRIQIPYAKTNPRKNKGNLKGPTGYWPASNC